MGTYRNLQNRGEPSFDLQADLPANTSQQLGHGSNVQKLETTATYIRETEEFEIHSPTLTSTKWWMGGLGVMATHCIVQAQLLVTVDGALKNYGPHLFIMRSEDEVYLNFITANGRPYQSVTKKSTSRCKALQ